MRDAITMLRRNARHTARNPGTIIMTVGMPVVLLLLFVGVLGGTLSAGMSQDDYIDYLVAGVLLMTVGYGSTTTALAVNRDMTQGIINRFRTMAISRASVLTGHVAGSTLRTLLSAVLVVAVALALGFRPTGDPVRWLAAAGVLALLTVAMTWIGVAVGLAAKTAEGTAPFTLIAQVLPFLSSAFVRPESMSGAVRWFAAHEPFTPIIDSLRGLLLGGAIGSSGPLAVGWCLLLATAGYLWARLLFRRDPAQ
ncbi:ABC-2 type transport system permease protein [Actinoplanes octamycinicus]|uniref:Transport permease protein n=1 Tax=Actinoplanes octamycinicus TaxID=135948 RepID=A0A7W7GZ89_9ACTN|nr:ABC transporter permease [Actinoplanes octamycinicus]MBB4741040.1 ABC-2 type transport system permease protein [Actinoplanes octamycinicus]GIE55945.1 transport permease protein [Actinoplanes octamycinicus]